MILQSCLSDMEKGAMGALSVEPGNSFNSYL
jgi:hypothetical protein